MKLRYIRLINFKQFYGEQIADFSTEPDLNVTVFHGLNGTGKTSLFMAINWCLYGIGDEGTGELLNKQTLEEALEGSRSPVVVTIGFKHNKVEYIAERVKYFTKTGENANPGEIEFSLSHIDRLGQQQMISNPEGKMDAILPKNVREYFFFDGEKMDDLTRPGNSKIEDAIKNIMRLPIIDKAERHLTEITKEYREEIKKIGSDQLDQLINAQSRLEIEIEGLKIEIKNFEQEINKGTRQVEELEEKLASSREVGHLQSQRNAYKLQIQKLDQQRQTLEEATAKLVNVLYPALFNQKAARALQIINSEVERGKIPSGINEQLIKEILEKCICICGRAFSEHTDAYETLQCRLRDIQPNAFEDNVLKLRGEIGTLSKLTSERLNSLNDKCRDYTEKEEEIESLLRKVDDLNRQIGDTQEIDIASLEARRREFLRNIELLNQNIGKDNNKIQSKQDEIKDIIQRREIEEKKQVELKFLSMREKLARLSTEAITSIKERFHEATREQIELKAKRVFDSLAWKTDQFNEIHLDPDFYLEVIDRWNRPSRQELSAGERQILSLAFITAMVQLSGEEAPVVMDTPFARLSGDHLKNVSKSLPDLVPQLILFVTDQEWNDSSRAGLEPRVGAQYQLKFGEGCTSIEKVKHG